MSPATDAPASAPSDAPTAGPTTGAPPVDAAAIDAARQVIAVADLSDPATIDEIGATLRFTAAGEWAAREILATDAATDVLWAALWVYGSGGRDPAPLQPLLGHDSPSLRTMAAASLIALGDGSGFAVLSEALSNEQPLLGSEPPITLQLFAMQTLQSYVAADGVPTEPESEEATAGTLDDWASWLEANADQLSFDAAQGLWIL